MAVSEHRELTQQDLSNLCGLACEIAASPKYDYANSGTTMIESRTNNMIVIGVPTKDALNGEVHVVLRIVYKTSGRVCNAVDVHEASNPCKRCTTVLKEG